MARGDAFEAFVRLGDIAGGRVIRQATRRILVVTVTAK